MRTSKEWMREDTWLFEVEVLGIYGAPRAVVTRFGARPVSDAPYQPVDAADVRRRVVFGARQYNEFAVRHCCVHRSRSVVGGTRVPRGTSKPLATTSLSERARRSGSTTNRIFGLPRKISNIRWRSSRSLSDGEERCPMEGRPFSACRNCVEFVSVRGCRSPPQHWT